MIFILIFIAVLAVCTHPQATHAQTPIMEWAFSPSFVEGNHLRSVRGPSAIGEQMPEFVVVGEMPVASFNGSHHSLLISDRIDTLKLPVTTMSVAAWVMVDYPGSWGGFLSVMQDNGDYEKGWVFGHVGDRFSIGLASEGANRNNRGGMTYLQASEPFRIGTWNHVAATYDGTTMHLYVNGEMSAQSTEQSGDILYPNATWFSMGTYRDNDENLRHSGQIHSIQLWDSVISPQTIQQRYNQHRSLRELPAKARISLEGITIKPYLNFITETQATVSWYSSEPSTGYIQFGLSEDTMHHIVQSEAATSFHRVTLENLQAGTFYFYRAVIVEHDGGGYETDLLTFQTATPANNSISFGVVGDTQNNPAVWSQISTHLWSERPQFVIHAGDLVSPGTNLLKWIIEYFAPSKQLQERVPIYSVLGNHERNADWYYTFMAYPQPQYYYTFTYGDVAFFMLDTNKDVGVGSEQYQWLSEQLRLSQQQWKIVVHHHPPYSSDENDYGDTWRTTSTRGDASLRDLANLYESNRVDLVIAGHIHTYERTWPVTNGRVDIQHGTTYVITGGAGGPLENAAPTRSWFARKLYRGHHYNMVHVAGGMLEWITYDLNGQIIDQFTISARSSSGE